MKGSTPHSGNSRPLEPLIPRQRGLPRHDRPTPRDWPETVTVGIMVVCVGSVVVTFFLADWGLVELILWLRRH